MKDFITWMLMGVVSCALVFMPARALSQGATTAAIVNSPPPSGGGGGVTWTVVQHPSNYSCGVGGSGNQSCSVTSSATTAGNLLILTSAAYNNTGTSPTFVSASGDGSWTHCPASQSHVNLAVSETADCVYILSATGGATTETFTWNFTTGTSIGIDVELYEVHRSTGTATYDTGGGTTSLTSCSSCSGPSISLSGGVTDFVATWGGFSNTPSAPGSPYTSPADVDPINVAGGFAGALNQSSYSTPVWTQSPASYAAISAVAFK
jgi:hypothetical protein